MLVTEQDRLRQDIERWVQAFGGDRSALMPALRNIQTKYRFISGYAMQILADLLNIHPVEVYGVVSFYSFLQDKPHGRFTIRLCKTISCDLAGKDRVARQLVNDLGIAFGETTADGKFTLEWTNCVGMCDQGPALLVNDQVFTRVTPEKARDILEGCRMVFGAHATREKEAVYHD